MMWWASLLCAPAQVVPSHGSLPNVDRRLAAVPAVPGPPAQVAASALEHLQARVPRLQVRWDPILRSPRSIHSRSGFLTPPGWQRGDGGPGGRATPEDPHRVVKDFLHEHRALFGYGPGALQQGRVRRESVGRRHGVRTVVWHQEHEGLEVFEGVLIAHLTRENELISLASQWVPRLPRGEPPRGGGPAPAFSGRDAVSVAAREVGEAGEPIRQQADPVGAERRQTFQVPPLPGPAQARLVWLPLGPDQLQLCWEVELTRRLGGERYRLLIDAEDGSVWIRRCLTVYLSEASYRVFTGDSPAPLTPALSAPGSEQAPLATRSLVTLDALSTNASPTGWIHDGINETRGNNVEAHLDRDANNAPDLPRPQGMPFRVFDFPIDFGLSPISYGDASVVQLFFWCNWMHDQLYELGFDEASGNFQKDNFGRGGRGGDPIIADAQDGSGVNNANYTPAADGISPRIQMFIFDGPDPDRDGGLDGEIILHEYTHGLTDRLVGGGVGITALQSAGMGEGWSDFYGLAFLSEPGDDLDGTYPVGAYTTFQFNGLMQNYYFGIRRYPYSTDMSKSPVTYKDIDPGRISSHPGVPSNPVFPFDAKKASQVHRQGEVWCAALWEIRANLIRKHGFESGNRLVLQLVTEGLRLSPPNPTFLQARDAILLADRVVTGGANQLALWSGFAKRGMGVSASGPPSWTTSGVEEAYDLPDLLSLRPIGIISFIGALNGTVSPSCRTLTLTNHANDAISFAAHLPQDWATVFPSGGLLAPRSATNLTVCIDPEQTSASRGARVATLSVSNLNSGAVELRQVQARVLTPASVPFSEDFEGGELASHWAVSGSGFPSATLSTNVEARTGRKVLLMESGLAGVSTRNELTLAVDLAGYADVQLGFWMRSFRDEMASPPDGPFLDGADFDGIAISENGFEWHPVAAYPIGSGGWTRVELDLEAARQRAGLSYGEVFWLRFNQLGREPVPDDGIALDDISISGLAPRRFTLRAEGSFLEGGEGATGTLEVPVPVTEPVLVELESDDPSQVEVPATLVLEPGMDAATFPIHVVDDEELDGTRAVVIAAAAEGFIGATTTVFARDNEFTTLSLSLPETVQEASAYLEEAGRVTVAQAPSADITIRVASFLPGSLAAGPTVTLPAGETEVPVDLQVFDDHAINGDRLVRIRADVQGWGFDEQTLLLRDDESTNVFVSAPPLLHESERLYPGALRVALSGTLTTNLEVVLASSDPNRISIPERTLIEAGSTSVSLPLTIHEDEELNAGTFVFLRGSAPAFGPGSAAVQLLDDELAPDPHHPRPPDRSVDQPLDTDLAWSLGTINLVRNGDFETGTLDGWIHRPGSNGGFEIDDGSIDPLGPGEPSPPLQGQYSALAAQVGPGRNELAQNIAIPSFVDAVWLNWSHRIDNFADDFATNQSFRVEIRDLAGNLLDTAFATAAGDPLQVGWRQYSHELSAFKGRFVRIAFVEEDSEGFLNVRLDNVELYLEYLEPTAFEVYFGTSGQLGPETFLGLVSEPQLELPPLDLDRDYYWRVVAKRGEEAKTGPVWRFRTRGTGPLDHFTWDRLAPVVDLGVPFEARLTARDDLGNRLSRFFGAVQLEATREMTSEPVQLLTMTTYADVNVKYRSIRGAIYSHFTNLVETNFSELEASVLRSRLVGKDVFLVMEQRFAPSRKLEELGETWGPVLVDFVEQGGVLAVCSYTKNEHHLLTASGLMDLTKSTTETEVEVSPAGSHPLLEEIEEPFTLFRAALYEPPTNAQPLLVDASNRVAAAVREVGRGLVVMLGSDYATNRTRMDELLARVVEWPRRLDTVPVALSPPRSGFFLEGEWNGTLTLEETGGPIRLTARASSGAKGESLPVSVRADQDLSVTVIDQPDPAPIGEPVEIRLRVSNAGPLPWEGVVLTNQLSPGFQLVATVPGQGTCQLAGETLSCQLGTVPAGQTVEVNLTVIPRQGGFLTNVVEVAGLGEDPFLPNNRVATFTRVNFANLIAGSVQVTEGNSTGLVARIPVGLHPPNALSVRVEFATTNTTATPGIDYLDTAGALVFPPGSTNQFIEVSILSDTLSESPEAFLVHLFNPVRGIILQSRGFCQILDDDPQPLVRIEDATVVEGPEQVVTNAVFPVHLDRPSGEEVSFQFASEDVTATAGRDYQLVSARHIVPAGTTNSLITVPVFGDDVLESNELFLIRLSGAEGVVLEDDTGEGRILDDDESLLDRFLWSEMDSPQFFDVPFPVVLSALDGQGNLLTGFDGEVMLAGLADPMETETGPGDGLWELPLETSFHDARLQAIYLPDELGGPSRLTGLSLSVAGLPGQRLKNWTIRLQHAFQSHYAQPSWKADGWVTVYQRDEAILETGWVAFDFTTPFSYNGVSPLLIDFSFNNATFSSGGSVEFTESRRPRSLHFRTDSGFADPLAWDGPLHPPPEVSSRVPRLRLRSERPVPITPGHASGFVNGQWRGELTVQAVPGTMQLRALDQEGHTATSAPFRVAARNDLALEVAVSPNPLSFDGPVTYLLTVTNSGPLDSTGVIVGNHLPPGVDLVSATSTQGTCQSEGRRVFCELGTLPAQATVSVRIEAVSRSLGLATNRASVVRGEPEVFLPNNSVETITPVRPPSLLAADVTVEEGDVGTNDAVFAVVLSNPTDSRVSIPYRASGLTASNGLDLVPVEGLLLLEPGETNGSLIVPVLGDRRNEFEETFAVTFGPPTNAVLGVEEVLGSIVDNDPLPLIQSSDARIMETDAGSHVLQFNLGLSEASGKIVRFLYQTEDDGATSGEDYQSSSGLLFYPPGVTNRVVFLSIEGDKAVEPDESFRIRFTNPIEAVLERDAATVTIVNDDGLPGVVDHFAWSDPGPVRVAGQPFEVTVLARDYFQQVVTNFNGFVRLTGREGGLDHAVGQGGSREWPFPFATSYHDGRAQVIYLAEEVGQPGLLRGLSLKLRRTPGQRLRQWTIRMKQTPLSAYLSASFETNDWLVVYQDDLLLSREGWATFLFQNPFPFDGTNNVMVDFSFNNAFFTTDGLVEATFTNRVRSLSAQSDSAHGNPLDWSGRFNPTAKSSAFLPHTRFLGGLDLPTTPGYSVAFREGTWSGTVSVHAPADQVRLLALDILGRSGFSNPFTVLTTATEDADNDGLPDLWELTFFGQLDAPAGGPDDDPDGDGASNRQEQRAGTNPTRGDSVFVVTAIEVQAFDIILTFNTEAGRDYQVERSHDLQAPAWEKVGDPRPGTGGSITAVDPQGLLQGPGFYRVRLVDSP